MKRALEGIRILVVDNDPDNSEMLQFYLTAEGAVVTTAADAREARSALRANPPDVLISDLGLPEEDGYALMASIRAQSATATLPAIALTGYSDDGALQRARKAGFDRRIVKPAHLPDVVATILALLGQGPPPSLA
jgi:CheY-like chemotaxis protein